MDSSIAFHVARIAQQEGAEVVLTSFGRTMQHHAARSRSGCPATPPVIELDASNAEDFAALADRVREHVDGLDGVLHSIGFAPEARWAATSSRPSGPTSRRRCRSRRTR